MSTSIRMTRFEIMMLCWYFVLLMLICVCCMAYRLIDHDRQLWPKKKRSAIISGSVFLLFIPLLRLNPTPLRIPFYWNYLSFFYLHVRLILALPPLDWSRRSGPMRYNGHIPKSLSGNDSGYCSTSHGAVYVYKPIARNSSGVKNKHGCSKNLSMPQLETAKGLQRRDTPAVVQSLITSAQEEIYVIADHQWHSTLCILALITEIERHPLWAR